MSITTLISVGFSALNQNLSVSGDIEYEKDANTLYGVLRKEASLGTYALKYNDTHHDSFTEEPTKDIYYWYAPNTSDGNTLASSIIDKWNVIFGGFCWQMIRTTDTGGVKLIYNGVPTSGKCNNTGTAQQIGTSRFNTSSGSPANVGYMYNTEYRYNTKTLDSNSLLTSTSMTASNNYYYGTGVTYSGGTYTLTGVTRNTWTATYASSSGLYTCASTTASSCSTVYYIVSGTRQDMYGFTMTGGHLLSYYNTNIIVGSSYTVNGGTYTLGNTTTLTKTGLFQNSSSYKNYYTCGNNSTSCSNLHYIVSIEKFFYKYISLPNNNYIYAKDFTYNNGTYTLGNDRIEVYQMSSTDLTNLKTHHYTCFNRTGQCNTLSYVYTATSPVSEYIYYIDLENGKSVEDAKNEMFYNNNVNTTNSTIKTYVDNWYSNNMTSYTNKLEDTIFCNSRYQSLESTNGWNPNGGNLNEHLLFGGSPSLQCINDTDKFSVANNKAKLIYPVGLLTVEELNLLKNSNLTKTGQQYWLGTPLYYRTKYSYEFTVSTTGGSGMSIVSGGSYGVRPVISLKPMTEYSSGTGTRDNPYVVQ